MAPSKISLTNKSLSPFSLHRPPWSFQANSSSPSPLQIEYGRNLCQKGEASTNARIHEVENKTDGNNNRAKERISAILQVVENVPTLSVEGKEYIRKALNLPEFLLVAGKVLGRENLDSIEYTNGRLQMEENADSQVMEATTRVEHGRVLHGQTVKTPTLEDKPAGEGEEKETDGEINYEEIEQIQSEFDLPHFLQTAERVLDRETMASFEDLSRLKSHWNKRPLKSVSQRTPTPYKSLERRSHLETPDGNSPRCESSAIMDEDWPANSSTDLPEEKHAKEEKGESPVKEPREKVNCSGPAFVSQDGTHSAEILGIRPPTHLNFEKELPFSGQVENKGMQNSNFVDNSCLGRLHAFCDGLESLKVQQETQKPHVVDSLNNENKRGPNIELESVGATKHGEEMMGASPNDEKDKGKANWERDKMGTSSTMGSTAHDRLLNLAKETSMDDPLNFKLPTLEDKTCGGPKQVSQVCIPFQPLHVTNARDIMIHEVDYSNCVGEPSCLTSLGKANESKEEKRNIIEHHKEGSYSPTSRILNGKRMEDLVCGGPTHVSHMRLPLQQPHLTNFVGINKGEVARIWHEEKAFSSYGGATSMNQTNIEIHSPQEDEISSQKEVQGETYSLFHNVNNCEVGDSTIEDKTSGGPKSASHVCLPFMTKMEEKNKEVGGKLKKSLSIFNPSSSSLQISTTPWILRQIRNKKTFTGQPRRTIIKDDKEPTLTDHFDQDTTHGPTPTTSYSSRQTLHFVAPEIQNGIPIIKPTQEIVEKGSQRWRNTAIGSFIGKRPNFHNINSFVRTTWKGIKEVVAAGNGFFLFAFKTEDELEQVLEGGPHFFKGQPIFLQRWRPGMKMDKPHHKQIPVWIKLKHLPLEYWTNEGLSVVASGVGKPLYPDRITQSCSRIDYARVCVLLDSDAQMPKQLVVIKPAFEGCRGSTCKIDVEYEWLPPKCSSCSTLGHASNACTRLRKPIPQKGYALQVYIPKVPTATKENAARIIRGKKKEVEHVEVKNREHASTRPKPSTYSIWVPKPSNTQGTWPGTPKSPKEGKSHIFSLNPKGTRPTTRPCSQPCSTRVEMANGDFSMIKPRGTRPTTRPCSSRVDDKGRGKELVIYNPFAVLDVNDADTDADMEDHNQTA